MRHRGLEDRITRWWTGEASGPGWALLSLLTLPLEGAFRGIVAIRNALYDRGLLRVRGVAVPVVSVGNLSVGGTGKTPVTGWLVRRLLERGRRPAVVARGYGEDELELHRVWNPGAGIYADPDRVAAARAAEAAGHDVLVLDDGFQHRRLRRDLDLVVISAEQGIPGRMLPRGPFREPRGSLSRAGAMVVTRKTATLEEALRLKGEVAREAPGTAIAVVRIAPGGWTDLEGRTAPPPEGRLLGVCSIGNPETFRGLVEEVTGRAVTLRAFPDHHDYDVGDVESIREAMADYDTLVTTQKDAVKLTPLSSSLPGARVLALEVEPEEGWEDLLEVVWKATGA